MLKHKINLSLLAQDSTPIINLVQMDTGRELECTITDFSIPVGATAKLWVIKPSGKIVSANGAIDGNIITVALSDQQVVESGLAVAQLKISNTGKIISSFSMYLNFQEDASANGIVSTEDIKLVDAFLQEQSKKLDDAIALKTAQIQKNTQDVTTLKEDLTKLDTSVKYIKGNAWNALENGCDNTGLTDCSDAVQNIINTCPEGFVLYFPKGEYLFKKGIILSNKKGLTIIGEGDAHHGTLFHCTSPYTAFTFYGGDRISVKDIAFKGESIVTSRAIFFYDNNPTTMACRISNTHFENLLISRFAQGVAIGTPSGYNYFDNVKIQNIADGGCGFSIGYNYKNTSNTNEGHVISPNYIYLKRCNIEGAGSNNAKGLSISHGMMIFVNECDICNFLNDVGVDIVNHISSHPQCTDIHIYNSSIYNNKIGISVYNANDIIERINIVNNSFLVPISQDSLAFRVTKKSDTISPRYFTFANNQIRTCDNSVHNFLEKSGLDIAKCSFSGLWT